MATSLTQVRIERAMTRPRLLFGCERGLIMTTSLLSLTGAIYASSLVGAGLSMGLGLVAYAVLVQLAQHDPQCSAVWIRALQYDQYYSPSSSALSHSGASNSSRRRNAARRAVF